MTNLDKAIRVLDGQGAYCGQCSREPGDPLDDCRDCAAGLKMYAQALKEAGLLMPDLSKPDSHDEENIYWFEGTFQVGISDKFGKAQITFADSEPGGVLYTDIESARDYALKILAACEYAEKGARQ